MASDDGIGSESPQIRVVAASRRMGAASDRGCSIAVKWHEDGEPSKGWLDDFLDELDCVEVPEQGLGHEIRKEYGEDDST